MEQSWKALHDFYQEADKGENPPMQPETRYVTSGDVNIAYQVVGDGPRDLVLVPGWVSNIEVFWEEPHLVRFLQRVTVPEPRKLPGDSSLAHHFHEPRPIA